MNIAERVTSPTPPFFKKIRNAGLLLAAVSGTLLAAPLPLPEVVTKIAAYLGVASTVASAVSQTAVCDEPGRKKRLVGDGS